REVTLYWRLSGIDSLGWLHDEIARGETPIAFSHHRVEPAARIRLQMPMQTMLCSLWVYAMTRDGALVASNYVQLFVDAGFPAREERDGSVVLREAPHQWTSAEWSEASSSAGDAEADGCCHGTGQGHFEWRFALAAGDLHEVSRIRVLYEASAHREGTPQTDTFAHPTTVRMLLNGVRVYERTLPNHPHDARGALSYLHGGRGAFGYLAHAVVEGALLEQVLANVAPDALWLRCLVPEDGVAKGGLTIYGGTCGRYPIPPTIIIDRADPGARTRN
ncbi:MAG: glycoside hydrolase family 2, partial [Verrucomicrobiota bacterium]|nr:glycoside hydrolase family 2 [Verrucomicrobiota bacterium]